MIETLLRWFIVGVLLTSLSACVNATRVAESASIANYRLIPIDASFHNTVPAAARAPTAYAPAKSADPYRYRLGAGDTLLVSLFVPDVTGQEGLKRIIPQPQALPEENRFELDENGNINLPFAGIVSVGGLTLADAQMRIKDKLLHYFRSPQLDVSIKDFSARKAVLTGEFKEPKELVLTRQPLTLLAAIEAAGGTTESADLDSALLERADGTRMPVDLYALLEQGDRRYNVTLQDGDQLHLPRNHGNKIFVTGEAMEPKSIVLDNKQATLTGVLTEVKGLNPKTADPSAVYVLREAAGGTQIYQLNLEEAQGYIYGNRFYMQPLDVVFVGSRGVTDWSRFVEQLLPGAIATLAQPAPYIVR